MPENIHTGTRWFSPEQNAGQNQKVKMDYTSFAKMELLNTWE